MYRKDIIGVVPREIEKVFFERVSEKQISLAAKRNNEFLTGLIINKQYNGLMPNVSEEPCDINYNVDFTDDVRKILANSNIKTIEYVLAKSKIVSSVAGTADKGLKLAINSLYGALTQVIVFISKLLNLFKYL